MTISQPGSLLLGLTLVLAACGGEGLTLPPDGAAANIEVMSGNGQSARVGSPLPESLVVKVTDTRDRPVAGADVVFEFTADGSAASPASVSTDADGRAASRLVLGTRVGPVTGTAKVPVDAGVTPVQATITATALPDNANEIALVSGNNQFGAVGTTLSAPLVVVVGDAFGNPIPDVTIEWSVTLGGSVSALTTVTGENGQASVTRTLGSTAGQDTTLATAAGLAGSPVTFTHTATAGTATGVVKASGDGQSALAGTEVADALVVQVLDAQQNPIPGRAVTWVPGTGDGTVNPQNSTTDAQGFASTRWTLGPVAGPNTVNAVVSGVGTATFTATGTAGSPSASNSSVSASPRTIRVGSTSTITVTVRDVNNNPVPGASVSPSSSGTGNEFSPVSATAGDNGVATFTFSSTVAETKTITATAGGVTLTQQTTVTVDKAPTDLRIISDTPDPSGINDDVVVLYSITSDAGTPPGDVTITMEPGPETCVAPAAAGSCTIRLTVPGDNRTIRATYAGNDGFTADSDTEDHDVRAAPVAVGDNYQTNEDATLTVGSAQGVLANDGPGLTAIKDSDPTHGTLTLVSNGSFTYAPEANYFGGDSFTYHASNGTSSSAAVTVTITVNSVNDAPVAEDDGPYSTPGADAPLTIAAPGVLANDSDPDGTAPTAVSASTPGRGAVTLNPDGSFTYTPNPGESGLDSFTYDASDGLLTSTATVTIDIQ